MLQKIKKRKTLVYAITVGTAFFVFIGIGKAALNEPGTLEDPLVTQSYVEKRIEQVKYYIDQKIQEVYGNVNLNTTNIQDLIKENQELKKRLLELEENKSKENINTAIPKLEVVELKNGQKLICKAGTEIILRGGKAKAIAGELGGLSDVTGAVDIKMDQNIPPNHLLIVPRDDGRGVYVEKYAIFMVRGEYEIK
ncbi:hypothetical protein [Caloranaerobacter azorensis]|uniref:Uncharacterized protein n=2 Tax=Caloranaerobacter azorensis TaxID=116090 RepID=A0A1M5TK20_9FIRM|nr:hypothetical protein [Caloranaerobacter azorensis]QIB26943.1 hypothetical protein G3A45_06340 [Caloranaerobacter azorensis]SHH51028.1 hypothetical protein SAMN02745135_01030 [Caloranaerobacter azorensis DSM 13643]